MLRINEQRPEQRGGESNAVWMDRQMKKREKQTRRKLEAERFDRRHRMVLGKVGPEDDVEYHDSIPGV